MYRRKEKLFQEWMEAVYRPIQVCLAFRVHINSWFHHLTHRIVTGLLFRSKSKISWPI